MVPLIVNREDIFYPLNMLGSKMNDLFTNIEHMDAARSELISTLKGTITHFKEENGKLTDNMKNYVDFMFQHRHHRRGVGAVVGALGSVVFYFKYGYQTTDFFVYIRS